MDRIEEIREKYEVSAKYRHYVSMDNQDYKDLLSALEEKDRVIEHLNAYAIAVGDAEQRAEQAEARVRDCKENYDTVYDALEGEKAKVASWLELEKTWDAQAIAKELEIPLGEAIRPNIMPKIKELKQELVDLEADIQGQITMKNMYLSENLKLEGKIKQWQEWEDKQRQKKEYYHEESAKLTLERDELKRQIAQLHADLDVQDLKHYRSAPTFAEMDELRSRAEQAEARVAELTKGIIWLFDIAKDGGE